MTEKPSKNDYFSTIGEIAIKFGILEMLLKMETWKLISNDRSAAYRITAGGSLPEIAVLFRSLFLYRVSDPPLVQKCQELYDSLEKIKDNRNEYLHSEWFIMQLDGETVATRLKARKRDKLGLKVNIDQNMMDKLKNFLSDMDKATGELRSLMDKSIILIEAHKKKNENQTAISFQ